MSHGTQKGSEAETIERDREGQFGDVLVCVDVSLRVNLQHEQRFHAWVIRVQCHWSCMLISNVELQIGELSCLCHPSEDSSIFRTHPKEG